MRTCVRHLCCVVGHFSGHFRDLFRTFTFIFTLFPFRLWVPTLVEFTRMTPLFCSPRSSPPSTCCSSFSSCPSPSSRVPMGQAPAAMSFWTDGREPIPSSSFAFYARNTTSSDCPSSSFSVTSRRRANSAAFSFTSD